MKISPQYLRYIRLILFLFFLREAVFQRGREAADYAALDVYNMGQIGLTFMLAFMLCLSRYLKEVTLEIRGKSIVWFVGIYAIGLASSLWSPNWMYSGYLAFEALVIMFSSCVLICSCKNLEQAEVNSMTYILVVAFIGIVGSVRMYGFALSLYTFGSVVNGYLGAIVMCYCLAELSCGSRLMTARHKKLLKTYSILGLALIIISKSSGTNTAAVVGLVVIGCISDKVAVKTISVFALLALILICLIRRDVDFFSPILFPNESSASIRGLHGRRVLWDIYFEKIRERPFLGWGFAIMPRITEQLYSTSTHNSVIAIIGGMGLSGLSLFLIFLTQYVREALAAIRLRLPGARGSLAAFTVATINSLSNGAFGEQAKRSSFGVFVIIAIFTFWVLKENEGKLGLQGRLPTFGDSRLIS